MARQASKIEQWVDGHRELILLAGVLPIGKVVSIVESAHRRWTRPRPDDHQARVARVVEDVRRYAALRRQGDPEGQRLLRTDRKGVASLNTRVSDKARAARIPMGDLRTVLEVDRDAAVVRVEPFATIGEIAEHLDPLGLQLEATIEMKDATIGGLVLAVGMTTHSHVCGLMHDIVEAYELVTAQGQWIRVTRDGEHAELFRALPWSHGTLGLLVALELRIVPSPTHVRVVYRPMYDLDAYIEAHTQRLLSDDPPFFLEAQVFGRDRAVIIEGHLASTQEIASGDVPVHDVGRWNQPFFFKHVESMLELGEGQTHTELVPTYSYLMRHDRSMCMT
ncbi:MAG: FAD-binding protein, partial [Deltaproteobacteria bacterium]|nr:FAD-binding protein [Deltaproteobacteria bacterium]